MSSNFRSELVRHLAVLVVLLLSVLLAGQALAQSVVTGDVIGTITDQRAPWSRTLP